MAPAHGRHANSWSVLHCLNSSLNQYIYIYIYIPEAINEVETESDVYADDTYQDKDVEKTEEVINK